MLTIRQLIDELGVSRDRVLYAIKQLGMEPRERHGRTLMYSRADLARIRRRIEETTQPPPKR
jgi:DNA-binding transcriptional MocR family regulator